MSKTLHYKFADNVSLEATVGPTLTSTRATTATVTDYNNVLRTVQANEARFTGGRRVENICLQSNDLSTTWANTASTDSQNVAGQTNPLTGAADVNSLNEDGTAATTHYIQQSNTGNAEADTITFSVYLKASNRTWAALTQQDVAGSTKLAYFDLANGVEGSVNAAFAGSGIVDVGGGWYRCYTTMVSDADADVRIYAAEADSDITYSGLSQESLLVYGAQLEYVIGQDDSAPSEYVPTTTAAAAKWYATKRITNLITYSSELDNAAWVKSFVTVNANQTTSPDGTTTADEIVVTTDSQSHGITEKFPVVAGVTYTYSAYVKAASSDKVAITRVAGAGFPGTGFWWADLTLGTIAVAPPTAGTASIESVGDGWYRLSLTHVASETVSEAELGIVVPNDSGTYNYVGAGESVYAWGAQVERGATATTFLPTSGGVASTDFLTAITPTGLLVEEARTNLCLQSEDLSTTWANTKSTDVSNVATAPDGTLTADSINEDGTVGAHFVSQPIAMASSTEYTYSVYAKASNRAWLLVQAYGLSAAQDAYFNLADGTIGTVDVGVTAIIEDAGGGWYRCSITYTTTTVSTPSVLVAPANADGGVSYTGLTQESVLVWGAQVEAGAFPLSYIPTTTASVTRNADDVDSSDLTWLNESQGSYYIRYIRNMDSAGSVVFTITDGTVSDRHELISDSSQDGTGDAGHAVYATATQYNNAVVNAENDGTANEMAATYATNDSALYLNGTADPTPDTTGTPPTGLTTVAVGRREYNDSLYSNGHIAEIAYFNTRLPNATLEDYSTNGLPSVSLSNIIFPRDSMPTDETRFQTFIDDSGITKTGDLARDYRTALHSVAGLSGDDIDYGLDDAFKRYYDSL
jgi:hypothetical protein